MAQAQGLSHPCPRIFQARRRDRHDRAARALALAFVEVKYRADAARAAEAITAAKRARITGAARAWLAANPQAAVLEARFDAILVTPWRLPVHIVDAWRE